MFAGPRMRQQPIIKAYQAVMPPAPAGSVPLTSYYSPVPTTQQAEEMENPLPASPQNIAAGKVYYSYYCLACHGEIGNGHGPVGESYVPTPTDLRSEIVRNYSQGRLLRSMLTGPGHEPVLEHVVLPQHRWPLVLYVRQLSTGKP